MLQYFQYDYHVPWLNLLPTSAQYLPHSPQSPSDSSRNLCDSCQLWLMPVVENFADIHDTMSHESEVPQKQTLINSYCRGSHVKNNRHVKTGLQHLHIYFTDSKKQFLINILCICGQVCFHLLKLAEFDNDGIAVYNINVNFNLNVDWQSKVMLHIIYLHAMYFRLYSNLVKCKPTMNPFSHVLKDNVYKLQKANDIIQIHCRLQSPAFLDSF